MNHMPPRKKSLRGRMANGAPNPVDVHIGKQLRLRRMMLSFSQQELAAEVGVAFQQIQKYECAVNRISTSRLWAMALALRCPVAFFYAGMDEKTAHASPRYQRDDTPPVVIQSTQADVAVKHETLKLLRAYYTIKNQNMRRHIFELAASLAGTSAAMD